MLTLNEVAARLAEHEQILLLTHRNPDGDTLGSAYGLCRILQAMGKAVQVRCSDPIPAQFGFFCGGIADAPLTSPYVVAIDVASPSLLGSLWEEVSEKVDLCIDHHPSNTGYAKESYVDADAAAVCEIIVMLADAMHLPLTPAAADCLYTGLITDSGCFRFSNTTPRTHRIAAQLIEAGARAAYLNEYFFERKSRERIAVEKFVLNTMQFAEDGKIALIEIPLSLLQETGAQESELDGVSSIPRTIDGVAVGITLRERGNGEYRVSLRTTALADASKIAANFGGGGHARAAGCTLYGERDDVARQLIAACVRELHQA